MKYLLYVAIFCSGIIFSLQSSAEMKKLRDWPAAIPAPSAELKKQYEYDPAAGAGSNKLISIESTLANPYGSTLTKINYVNGAPVSGVGDWSTYVMAYHWFLYIASGSTMNTKVVNYTDSGSWPSKSIKFLVVNDSNTANYRIKTTGITECKQGRSFVASNIFPSLPGKVYEYKCSSSASSSFTGNNVASEDGMAPVRSTAYYSEYLDMNLVNRSDGVQQWTTYNIEFIGSDNKPHLLSYRDDQIALP
jgi:hypothetical protein